MRAHPVQAVLWTAMFSCFFATARSTATSPEKQETRDERNVEHDLTPDLGPIQKAGSWIGKTVTSADGKTVGKIDDLVVDLDTSYVALFLIAPEESPNTGRRAAVPATLVLTGQNAAGGRFSEAKFRSAPTIGASSNARPLTRRSSVPIFEHFDVKPRWSELEQKLNGDDVFVYLSSLRGQSVREPDGTHLGHIEDFALGMRSGRIAYAALAHAHSPADKKLYPIPLGAFVVQPDRDAWTLELPDKLLDATPAISGSRWPTEIGRGWVEYVHVRYGRGELMGVQRSRNADPTETPGEPKN